MLIGDFIASVGVFEVARNQNRRCAASSDDRARQRRQAPAQTPVRAYSSRCTGNKRHMIGYALVVRQDQANLQADMPLGPWMPARRLQMEFLLRTDPSLGGFRAKLVRMRDRCKSSAVARCPGLALRFYEIISSKQQRPWPCRYARRIAHCDCPILGLRPTSSFLSRCPDRPDRRPSKRGHRRIMI